VFISGYSNPETHGVFAPAFASGGEHGSRHDRMIANEPLDDVTAATNPTHSSTLLGQHHPVDPQRGLPTARTPSVLPDCPWKRGARHQCRNFGTPLRAPQAL